MAEKVPNLWAVESVDSSKKADALDKGRAALKETQEGQGEQVGEEKLRVFIQVNTSGEDSKSGTQPGSETLDLCKHVVENCPHLQLQGLMTIGAIARSQAVKEGEENEDFISLTKERDGVLDALGWKEVGERRLELSMGMSADFEQAIQMGSDEVRVGSEIFGARPPKGST